MNVIITFTLLSAILLPFFQVRSQASNWYDSNWLYRQKLTVQSSKVPNTDQANFPVYVDLSDMKSGFFSNVKSDGSDLVVTSSDGTTKLDRELVSINTGSSSGELWFKAPNLSNTANTVFYIYYGNSSASETNSTNVWSNGYEIVQHMSEDPSASAPQMQDSTSNNHDGTASGSMSTGNRVAAKIGNGYDLNGSGNYINFGDNNSFSFINGSSDSDFMLSGWIRIDAFGPNAYGSSFIGKMDSAGKDYEYNLFLRHDVNQGQICMNMLEKGFDDAIGRCTDVGELSLATYYHVVGMYDGSENRSGIDIIINGSVVDTTDSGSGTYTGMSNTDTPFTMGGLPSLGPGYYHNGIIDEIHVHNTIKSQDWVVTEYNNQSSSSTFYSITNQETEGSASGALNTSVNVSNAGPTFKSGTDVYEDPTSDSTSPTDEGSNVTFKATAEDANEDNYFLIICSSNSVTAEGGIGNAPSCGATEYCVSSSTTAASGSEVEASCSYTTTGAEAESNDWYAFVCDDVTGSICSSASQGTLVDGSESPFKVNHDPTFTALNADGADDPGGDVVFTATASDSDTDGTSDTVQMFVCDNSGATSSGCSGTEYCSSTSVASNPSCTYNYPAVIEDGNYTVYGHVFDSHGLASSSNPQTVDYTVNNVAPVVSSVVINAGITINLTESTTTPTNITGTVTDNNSCEDLVYVEASLYRSAITYAGCDLDAEDDYDSCYAQVTCTVDTGTCSSSTDAVADYTCIVPMQYHADPTVANTEYPAENWLGTINANDASLSGNSESAAGVEVNALVALDITESSIGYGAVDAGGDTGSTNQTVEVTATGNVGLDTDLNGNGDGMCISSFTSPSCPADKIDLSYQEYSSSAFTYGAGGTDLSSTAAELELNTAKTIHNGIVSASAADIKFNSGIDAPATSVSETTLGTEVPVGASTGNLIVTNANGASNTFNFVVGDGSIPDLSGEASTWQTTFGGTISSNTTWTQDTLITSNVTVNNGATLTIDPGVTVFFSSGTNMYISGTINAVGTSSAPIYFTSSEASPAAGDWGSIRFELGSIGSDMEFSVIRYATDGLYFYGANTTYNNTISGTFANMRIENNSNSGIRLLANTQYPNSNGKTQIVSPTITNSLIQNNNLYGIQIYSSTGYGTSTNSGTIQNNIIQNNDYGFYMYEGSWWQGHVDNTVIIRNNSILNNSVNGIYDRARGSSDNSGSDTYSATLIENNLFESNGDHIYLLLEPVGSDGTQILTPTIRYNSFNDATGDSLIVDDTESFDTLNPSVTYNVFNNNNGYDINEQGSRTVVANTNYWGDTSAEWDAGPQGVDKNGSVTTSTFLDSTDNPVITKILKGQGQVGNGVTINGANLATGESVNVPDVIIGTADTYWGIGLPAVITSGSYYGETIITAVLGETAGW